MSASLKDGSSPLLERDAELAVIDRLLEAARGGVGGGLLIEGSAGIGKTRLVQAAQEQARASGMRVLAARGRELERDFAFGVARRLYELPLSEAEASQRAALLTGAAKVAAPVLGLAEAEQRAVGGIGSQAGLHGLYWLTANLTDLGPLLIAVDDAHWADVPSLRFLIYLLGRLEELPILLVAAARPAEPQTDRSLLDVLRRDPLCNALRLELLSQQAVCHMVRAGLAGADEAFCAACHAATAGNPLWLSNLIGSLQADEVAPRADQVNAVHDRAPGIAAAWVMPRLGRLPATARAVARAVAIFGAGAELRHAAALAELDSPTAAEAVDMLITAELLAPGRPLEFAHPVIRQAIYDNVPSAERHHGHVLAARLLAYDGVSAELIAAHLLVVERLNDPWVIEVLRKAAGSALAKGVPATAVTYLRRALEEPPDPATRPQVLLELGSAQFRAAQADAFATLEQALELSTDPSTRGMIALELARALAAVVNQHGALVVLERAVDELGDTDPDLRIRLEAELISLARLYSSTRSLATQRLRRLRDQARPDSLAGCLLLANLAHERLQQERAADHAVQLAERAVSSIGSFAGDESSLAVLFLATTVLVCTDRLDLANRACEAVIARARKTGSSLELGSASAVRSDVAYRRGAILDAEADARLADSIAREFELGAFGRRYTLAFLVNALIERGELATAAQYLELSGIDKNLVYLLEARGRLHCAQGRIQEGLEDFLACGRRLDARGIRHPGVIPWRSRAALALHQLGDKQEARRLAGSEIAAARKFGAQRALGIALRAAGLMQEGISGIELLHEAVAVLAGSPARLEYARALTDLGAALRRANHRAQARQPLRLGLDLAHDCGATALATRALEELTAAGARPRRLRLTGLDALTVSERRIAHMAAKGLSNREIAQTLLVTEKTVEAHLGNAYRKLHITRRTELPQALHN